MPDENKYMHVLDVLDDDMVNYKKVSMVIAMPRCDFKCNIEAKECICQNYELRNNKVKRVNKDILIQRYLSNKYSKAIVFAGLEPMDNTPVFDDNNNMCFKPLETEIYEKYNNYSMKQSSYTDMIDFIILLRQAYKCNDDIIIYTGYDMDELFDITEKHGSIYPIIDIANKYDGDIIIKYGRYRKLEENKHNSPYFNKLLGVKLATSNQYTIKYNNKYDQSNLYFCGEDVKPEVILQKIGRNQNALNFLMNKFFPKENLNKSIDSKPTEEEIYEFDKEPKYESKAFLAKDIKVDNENKDMTDIIY